MKRAAIQSYFDKNCNANSSSNDKSFWRVIKPYFTNSGKCSDNQVSLLDNDARVSSDQGDVCNIFNDFFVNLANGESEPDYVKDLPFDSLIHHYSNHTSVTHITTSSIGRPYFNFNVVKQSDVLDKLNKLNINKACGYDNLPAKLVRCGSTVLSRSFTPLINDAITKNTFPNILKYAEVSPIFKKGDNLQRSNYRPVSVLTSLSKVAEGLICDQLMTYFSDIMSVYLSAYRKGYSCENVLIKCVEDWRSALDSNETVGAILIDLSKAFDSLPHGLIIAKLHAYGMSENACHLVRSYLSDRYQRVKLNNVRSDWKALQRGVPQGSLMGPVLFNLFLNDLYLYLNNQCTIYNYADDNTLSHHHKDPSVVKNVLDSAAMSSLNWFHCNFMQANPSKFQAIVLSRDPNVSLQFNVNGNVIEPSKTVKLLGISLDNDLSFNNHVATISKKTGKQLNAMSRMSKYLSQDCLMNVFQSFFMSSFNYCPLVWHLCGIGNSRKLEKLHKRALRIVYNNYEANYCDLVRKCNSSSLYMLRLKRLAVFVYKVLNGHCKPVSDEFYELVQHEYNTRSIRSVKLPRVTGEKYGRNSLLYQGASLWNSLPSVIKSSCDINVFKDRINAWKGVECNCGFCLICTILRM